MFDKILDGSIPSTKVFEDDKVLAFRDVNPQAPVHIVLIPKTRGRLTMLEKATEDDSAILGTLLLRAS